MNSQSIDQINKQNKVLYRDKTVVGKRIEIALTGTHAHTPTHTRNPPNLNLLITPPWHNADPGCYKWRNRVLCKEWKPPSSHRYKVFCFIHVEILNERYEMKIISPEMWSLYSCVSCHKWQATQQALKWSVQAHHIFTEPILLSNFSKQLFLFFPLKFKHIFKQH